MQLELEGIQFFLRTKEASKGYDSFYATRMDRMPKPLIRVTIRKILNQERWRFKAFGPPRGAVPVDLLKHWQD